MRVFETERLICRRFTWDDVTDLHRNWATAEGVQHEYDEALAGVISFCIERDEQP